MTKILFVDDEESIRRVLRLNLEPKGFLLEEAASGREAIEIAKNFRPQIIILDLGLPDVSGEEVLKEIRVWSTVPIIVLTANDDEAVKVSLLESGADDYITKPFSPRELLARINIALRHHKGDGVDTPVFTSSELCVELAKKRVEVSGVPVHLTATEFLLLAVLVKRAGQVVGQEEILREVWGAHSIDNSHYLRIYIGQLRKKLELTPSLPQHILTEPGVGYRIV